METLFLWIGNSPTTEDNEEVYRPLNNDLSKCPQN